MQDKIIHVAKWPYKDPPAEEALRQLMLDENLEPYRWTNDPGDYYDAHVHNYHKVIYVVSGSITFDLPAGVRHNAAVGPEGVVCLEARK